LPNLNNASLLSEALGRSIRLKVCANALRTVEHRGGLDAFLNKAKTGDLSLKARRFKRLVEKAQSSAS
jgi:large subunit ribosomal protein L28